MAKGRTRRSIAWFCIARQSGNPVGLRKSKEVRVAKLAVKYYGVTVVSVENDQTLQCRANEMEQPPGTCMVSGIRAAPVRLIVRDGATVPEINRALEALRANLNELLDALPTRGGGGDYVS